MDIKLLKVNPKIEYFFDDITGSEWTDFVESIRRNGVLTPIVIDDSTCKIISGNQRYRACKELGIGHVPVEKRVFRTNDEETLAIIESNIRQRGKIKGPSIKLGRIMRELERIYGIDDRDGGGSMQKGQMSRKTLYDNIGVDRKIAQCAKGIASMPEEVQSLIDDGIIKPRVAYDYLISRTPEEQRAIAKAIRDEKSLHVTTKQIQLLTAKEPKGEQKMINADYTITRPLLGHDIDIILTDEEAEVIARKWLDNALNHRYPVAQQNQLSKADEKMAIMEQRKDEIIRRYQSGESAAEIGRALGFVSGYYVQKFLTKNHIHVRSISEAQQIRVAKERAAQSVA